MAELRSLEKERHTPADTHSEPAIRATWLLPSCWLYAVFVLLSGILVGGMLLLNMKAARAVLDSMIPMQIGVVILSLAVPVVSTYSGIRGGDELSIAYLWDVTRFARFVAYAGAAVVANLTGWLAGTIVATGSDVALVPQVIMGIIGLGLTIGTILALIALMLEVILVASRPGYAVGAGAQHHALLLAEGLHRYRYNTLFMKTHQELLDTATEQMPGVEGPSRVFSLYPIDPEDRPQTSPWLVDGQIKFDTHSLDYDLNRMRTIASTLPSP